MYSAGSAMSDEMHELIVKNCFYEFVPKPFGKPRRKSFPDILLRACVPDVCDQVSATQSNSVLEDSASTRIQGCGVPSQIAANDSKCITTLMLRNVPCKVNLEIMEVVLMQLGYEGTYDYLYFPARKNGSNLGFGFVNFMDERDAVSFEAAFTGYVFTGIQSSKQCYVTAAAVQGREANLRMHESSV
eukprot:TRINITY_DN9213_c0_g2_i2.p1 TRINITY_DN9213_c0_g2~~TRINITY_DN9213_c0_g2_i2.p1  ORF type:complete len:187 (+),score=33.71 TRINITY_DN9213_c0_g2_i2:52-612(+)